ncbi:MAG: APC family permease [Myxococcota bacterium]
MNQNKLPENQQQNPWKANIGLGGSTAIVVGSMLGIGVFLAPQIVAKHVPSPSWFLLVWIIGGIMAFAGAMCYGELGSRYPKAGGDYTFLKEAYGKPVAFLSGWTALTATFSGSIAATAVGLAQYYIGPHFGSWFTDPLVSLGPASISWLSLTAIGLIAVFTIINIVGVSFSSTIQGVVSFTPLIILSLAAIYSLSKGSSSSPLGSISNTINSKHSLPSGLGSISIDNLALALLPVFFAYSGWNASSYVGGEIKNGKKILPLSLLLGIGLITFLYILLNLLFLKGETINSLRQIPNILEPAALKAFGRLGVPIFISLTGFAILGSLNSTIMTGPRIYHSMAADKLLFRAVGKLSKTSRTPFNGLLIQAVIASTFVVLGGFEDILKYTTIMIIAFSAITVFGIFILRRRNQPDNHFKTPLHPLFPIIYLVMAIAIITTIAITDPRQLIVSGIMTIIGIASYFIFHRTVFKRGKIDQN